MTLNTFLFLFFITFGCLASTTWAECIKSEQDKFEQMLVAKKCRSELQGAVKARLVEIVEKKLPKNILNTLQLHKQIIDLVELSAESIINHDKLTVGDIKESVGSLFHVAVTVCQPKWNKVAYGLKPVVKKNCEEEMRKVCKKSDCCKKKPEQPRPCDINPMMPC